MAEQVLQRILGDFISLPEDEIERNNIILKDVLDQIIGKMCRIDELFRAMYRRIFYGGSYYDGLRVGKPEEYDLDLLLALPKYAAPTLVTSNTPGFVHVKMQKFDEFMRQPEAQTSYRNFGKLFDNKNYLSSWKVLAWVQGVLMKAMDHFRRNDSCYAIQSGRITCKVSVRKGGTALTLHITSDHPKLTIDVDLVSCFVFTKSDWPKNGFRPNPVSKSEFFIVPKKPKIPENQPVRRYWRLSFQVQERELIAGKKTLKPTVRLLKKLRDNLRHSPIASYYIKVVALWINEEDPSLWDNPLSHVFFIVLKRYKNFIAKGNIPYYWYKNNNLLGNIPRDMLTNISKRLAVVVKDVESNPQEPRTIAKYLLSQSEYLRFMSRDSF